MVEFENFGWNPETISFLGTVIFSLLGAWGLIDQAKKIFKGRSGKSVSNYWFICSMFLFACSFLYGVSTDRLAVIINGVTRFFPCLAIVIGLWKYKGFNRWQQIIFLPLGMIVVLMIVLPEQYKGFVFLACMVVFVAPLSTQPREIWKNKSAGDVSIKLLSIVGISSLFWVIYSLATWDPWILIFASASFLLILATVILWFVYREVPA